MRDLVGIWWGFATTDPPRLFALGFAVSKLRFRLRLRLHGVVHNTPSPMAGDLRRLVAVAGGIPMACGRVGSLEYFL